MGKIYQTQQQLQEQIQDNQTQGSSSSPSSSPSSSELFCDCCWSGCLRIRKLFSFKCVLILILSLSIILSAIFWIPPFSRLKSGLDANAAGRHNVTVQGRFRLHKPVSRLTAFTSTLEDDILQEIGVPNTKVSILSMNQAATSNWTDVVFGVLPNPSDVPLNLVSLSVLRSSMVELFLRRLNLSLTTSLFGEPTSFEIVKLSGGIHVVPSPSAYMSKMPQILFNFTLNNSISQLDSSFDQFKDQLKFGLYLKPEENVYIQLQSDKGSTIYPPVIVEASVISDIGTHHLLPQRLKQLAQTITKSPPAKNLGLDHSRFGKVKGICLSSALNLTLHPSPPSSPTPSPSQSPSSSKRNYHSAPLFPPHPAPSPLHAPVPSAHHQDLPPCSGCGASFPHAPIPAFGPQPHSPPNSESPSQAMPTLSPRRSPCRGFTVSPSPVPTAQFLPSSPPSFSPRAASPSSLGHTLQLPPISTPSPTVSQGPSPNHGSRRGKVVVLPAHASSPISPSFSSSVSVLQYREIWLIGTLVPWLFHLLL